MSILAAGIVGATRRLDAVDLGRVQFAEAVGKYQAALAMAAADRHISPAARMEFVADLGRLNRAWNVWGDVVPQTTTGVAA